jgi:hypothetical protein
MNILTPIPMAVPRRIFRTAKMRLWLHKHRIVTALLWAAFALGAIECVLLSYFLDSWVTLPTL